jgi:hypothetical protein
MARLAGRVHSPKRRKTELRVTFTPIHEPEGELVARVASPEGVATVTLDLRRPDGVPLVVLLPSGTMFGATVDLCPGDAPGDPETGARPILADCMRFVVECFERDALAHLG